MIAPRAMQLLLGAGLAHCIASLDRVLERHHSALRRNSDWFAFRSRLINRRLAARHRATVH